jgi:thiamine-phosphate pyrophosphorylase
MSLAAIDRLMGDDKVSEARATLARVSRALNARNAGGRNLPPLILMTDDQRDADYSEAVRALPAGSAIIVRHRDATKREQLAVTLCDLARSAGTRCLIAGDLTLAERLDADGIHARETDLHLMADWRARHPRWLITGAIHSTAAAAKAGGADALLLAPVFPTRSHEAVQALGVANFESIASRLNVPVYALGGIVADNAEQLAATHAAGIALIGGWLRS